ncbi:MAG: hypothetical protein D6820_17125 [Lentisphaerae bacterium]|nr:MAG: hypothetical protein D6820_17125 [Lentisphaerota bacterium]
MTEKGLRQKNRSAGGGLAKSAVVSRRPKAAQQAKKGSGASKVISAKKASQPPVTGQGRPNVKKGANKPSSSPVPGTPRTKATSATALKKNGTASRKTAKNKSENLLVQSQSQKRLNTLMYTGAAVGGLCLVLIFVLVAASGQRSMTQDIKQTARMTGKTTGKGDGKLIKPQYTHSSQQRRVYADKKAPDLKLTKIKELDGGMTMAEYMKKHNTLQQSELYQMRKKMREEYLRKKREEQRKKQSQTN